MCYVVQLSVNRHTARQTDRQTDRQCCVNRWWGPMNCGSQGTCWHVPRPSAASWRHARADHLDVQSAAQCWWVDDVDSETRSLALAPCEENTRPIGSCDAAADLLRTLTSTGSLCRWCTGCSYITFKRCMKCILSNKTNNKTISVTCHLSARRQGSFLKFIAVDGSPRGESPIRKNVYFLPGNIYLAPIGVKICMMVHIGPRQVFSSFGSGTPRQSP